MSSDSVIKGVVKWGKKTIEIDMIPSNGVLALKADLEDKTGVCKERMKLMPKSKGLWKGILKDGFDLTSIDYSKFKSSGPIQILLMGSASKLSGPKVKTTFVEDLPPEEAAKVAAEPSGLINLGNTCYLNSVVQCLRAIPALRSGLTHYANSNNNNNNRTHNQSHRLFLSNLRDLYRNLDRTAEPVTPSPFVLSTKMAFPQFAQTGPGGQPMQQDAEEFYSGLLTIAAGETKGTELIKAAFTDTLPVQGNHKSDWDGVDNLIDALFGIQMEETLTCDELEGATTSNDDMDLDSNTKTNTQLTLEPPVTRHDLHRKLVCNIQGGSDTTSQVNVTHIMEGITLSLNGKVQKRSEVLGRDAIWTRKQSMARLPSILVVQFGRFYWKETPDSQDHAGVKCKVMKPVAFQGILDVYEFCSEKVQAVLKVARDQALKEEEEEINKKLAAVEKENKMDDEANEKKDTKEGQATPDAKMDGNDDDDDDDLKAAMAMSMQTTEDEEKSKQPAPILVGPGLPPNFQGKYELFAVVTHKGRDADGGHYMGWVKAENDANMKTGASKIGDTDEDNDDWFVFDDDEGSPCKTEDVLKLKGGGDWHMSYLNFYRAKK